jgi:hypothetical protein
LDHKPSSKLKPILILLVGAGLFVAAFTYSPVLGRWSGVDANGVAFAGTIHPGCDRPWGYGACPVFLHLAGRSQGHGEAFGETPDGRNRLMVIRYGRGQHSSPCQIHATVGRESLRAADLNLAGVYVPRAGQAQVRNLRVEVTRAGVGTRSGMLRFDEAGEVAAWSTWPSGMASNTTINGRAIPMYSADAEAMRDEVADGLAPAALADMRAEAGRWLEQQVAYFSGALGTPVPLDCDAL